MRYLIANAGFETMDTTEDGRILFNPASGEVHMLDAIGSSIYSLLEQPLTLDELVESLSRMYDAPVDVIAEDVQAYIEDAVSKEILQIDER